MRFPVFRVHWLPATAAVAIVYFLAAAFGLSLATVATQVSPVWPPTGIGLAAILLLGYRIWPGLAVGAFAINAISDESVFTAAGIAIGNTLESIVGVALLRHIVDFRPAFDRPRDVIGFAVCGAILGPVISATVGVSSLCLGGVAAWSQFARLWSTWWLGDGTGALVVGPALMTWGTWLQSRRPFARKPETFIFLLATAAAGYVIFVELASRGAELKYLLFPFFVWSALRLGQAASATAMLIVSAMAIYGIQIRSAVMTPHELNAQLLLLQTFVAVLAVGSLTLGAVAAERERIAEKRREGEERLSAIFHQAICGVVQMDQNGRFQMVNQRFCEIMGRSAHDLSGRRLHDLTHPDDLPALQPHLERCIRDGAGLVIEGRLLRPDGSPIWVSHHVSAVRDAAGRPAYLVSVIQDVSERRTADERQRRLVSELNHRVKNTLASVQSIVARTGTFCEDQAEFQRSVEARLRALAHTHSLLSKDSWSGADLADIVSAELTPHSAGAGRAKAAGPRVYLRPQAALSLHLVLHELTTNAAKYGSLSVPTGRVEVTWDVRGHAGKQELCLHWTESGGPVVQPPKRRGFGTEVVEGSVAYELEGSSNIEFRQEGVRCEIVVPWRESIGFLAADAPIDVSTGARTSAADQDYEPPPMLPGSDSAAAPS